MKKSSLNILGRKNRSLFDTNVQIKEMDNVELVLDSPVIPESGTAKVRSRPTVKHFTAPDGVQGFAVPTPKVPVLPPFNPPNMNGTNAKVPNGGLLSIPDMIEGEILIPPPPSTAPPPPPAFSAAPPPPSFIPPSPKYPGQKDPSIDVSRLQPPPMPPPKPPSLSGSEHSGDLDLASLKPPPMAPPKPPSDSGSLRASTSSLEVQDIPECPKFTPPPPPVGNPSPVLQKAPKTPPPKPVRMSSIPNLDVLSQTPPQTPSFTPTPSSFNPQNTARLYNVQKSMLFSQQPDKETQRQSILLLEDSSGNPVGVHVNGNNVKTTGSVQPIQSVAAPAKPLRRGSSSTQLEDDQQDKLDSSQNEAPKQAAKQEATISPEPVTAPTTQNIPSVTPMKVSPKIEKSSSVLPDVGQLKAQVESPGRLRKYSPILNHRHLNTQRAESSGKTAASPFALLMAAKEREKQRTALSRANSGEKKNSTEPQTAVIQQSTDKPNSFTVIPQDPTSDTLTAGLRNTTNMPAVTQPLLKGESPNVSYSRPEQCTTPQLSPSPQLSSSHNLMTNSMNSVPVRDEESGENMPFIPPPPEFANSDPDDEPLVAPPSHPAPKPPVKTVPPPTKPLATATPAPVTSSPPVALKPKPPSCPPKTPTPPAVIQTQPKPSVQTKAAPPPAQTAPSVAASQATLLSILQKKMLEMDPKFSTVKEVELNGDDWNSPLSDEEGALPPAGAKSTQIRSATLPAQSRSLNMKELENKATQKAQDLATSAKSQNSNGPSTKQQFGMTFTVRPGSKQPITPVIKDSST